eukprot:gene17900-biopygen543
MPLNHNTTVLNSPASLGTLNNGNFPFGYATCQGLFSGQQCNINCDSASPAGVPGAESGQCPCDEGYVGRETWNSISMEWVHTCTPIPCGGGPRNLTDVLGADYTPCQLMSTGQTCTLSCLEGFQYDTSTTTTLPLVCTDPNGTSKTGFQFNASQGTIGCVPASCPANSGNSGVGQANPGTGVTRVVTVSGRRLSTCGDGGTYTKSRGACCAEKSQCNNDTFSTDTGVVGFGSTTAASWQLASGTEVQ